MEANATVDAENNYGNTPLHFAARRNHEPCVKTLLAARAQVDLFGYGRRTALAEAIESKCCNCAELLLHAGAKIQNINFIPIPFWMNELVKKYNNFKASYIVLYGVLRRRINVPHLFDPRYTHPSPMMLLICSVLLDTQYDAAWKKIKK